MTWCRFAVILLVVSLYAAPAPAGIFFNRRKPNEADKVSQLINTARTDRSDRRRASAVGDLRGFDVNAHPEIVSVLIERLQQDPSASVRQEAAEGLSQLRAVSSQAGQALQQAQAGDASRAVRREAKKALAQHQANGFGGGRLSPQPAGGLRTDEPPMAENEPVVKVVPRPSRPAAPAEGDGPILAEPTARQPAAIPVARPLPNGPRQAPAAPPATLAPAEAPQLVKPPSSAQPAPATEGPELKDPF